MKSGLQVCLTSMLISLSVSGCKTKEAGQSLPSQGAQDSVHHDLIETSKYDIEGTLRKFKAALMSNSSIELDSVVDPSGLTVIRNFTSGSNGGRGENIRNFYEAPIRTKFPVPEFPVPNETPVKLSVMFPEFRKSSESSIKVFSDTIDGFGIHDDSGTVNPSTTILVDALKVIAEKHHDVPTAFAAKVNGDYLVLAEGDAADGICTGYYSLFAKRNSEYRLKAILDLR